MSCRARIDEYDVTPELGPGIIEVPDPDGPLVCGSMGCPTCGGRVGPAEKTHA